MLPESDQSVTSRFRRNSGNFTEEELSGWLLESAKFRLAHGMPEQAAVILEELLEREPGNVKVGSSHAV